MLAHILRKSSHMCAPSTVMRPFFETPALLRLSLEKPTVMCLHSSSCIFKKEDDKRPSSQKSKQPHHRNQGQQGGQSQSQRQPRPGSQGSQGQQPRSGFQGTQGNQPRSGFQGRLGQQQQQQQQQQRPHPPTLLKQNFNNPAAKAEHLSNLREERKKKWQAEQQANTISEEPKEEDEDAKKKWEVKHLEEIQLIGMKGENHGLVSMATAQQTANEEKLVLQQVGKKPTGHIIYKLMTAEQQQNMKNKPKQQRKSEVMAKDLKMKEVQIRAGIGDNDLKLKLKNMQKFLDVPCKVKLEIKKPRRANITSKEAIEKPLKEYCGELLGKLDGKIEHDVVTAKGHVYRCIVYKV